MQIMYENIYYEGYTDMFYLLHVYWPFVIFCCLEVRYGSSACTCLQSESKFKDVTFIVLSKSFNSFYIFFLLAQSQ